MNLTSCAYVVFSHVENTERIYRLALNLAYRHQVYLMPSIICHIGT